MEFLDLMINIFFLCRNRLKIFDWYWKIKIKIWYYREKNIFEFLIYVFIVFENLQDKFINLYDSMMRRKFSLILKGRCCRKWEGNKEDFLRFYFLKEV